MNRHISKTIWWDHFENIWVGLFWSNLCWTVLNSLYIIKQGILSYHLGGSVLKWFRWVYFIIIWVGLYTLYLLYHYYLVMVELITIEFDASISVSQGVLGDTLVSPKVRFGDRFDSQLHVDLIGVIQENWLVLWPCGIYKEQIDRDIWVRHSLLKEIDY